MNRKTFTNRRRNAGFGILEIMITLSIVLVLVAIVVAVSSGVRADGNASKLQTQVLQISNQASTLANGGSFSGMTLDLLVDAEKIPNSWVVETNGNSVVRNPFGGDITMEESNGSRLDLIATQIPTGICTTVASNTIGAFTEVHVDGTAIASNATPAAIAGACSNDGEAVTMTFRMGREIIQG